MLGAVAASATAKLVPIPTGPEGDAFYVPPDPLPKAKPGTIIWARPVTAPPGANGWLVLYHSRSVAGKDVAVSGVVYAPQGPSPKGGRPIVSWGHGGAGVADACAPTRLYTAEPEILGGGLVGDLIAQGVVVVATDYEGLGTPGVAPFLVGESEGRSLLDAARAAHRMPDAGAGRSVIVAGHSEGGQSALFAGELARSYAPELRVLGVTAGAPAADMTVIVPIAVTRPLAAGYGIMALIGLEAAYPKAKAAAVLTPDALSRTTVVNTGCTSDVLTAYAAAPQPLVTRDLSTWQPWARLLRKNSAGNRVTKVPVLVYQGDADPTIPKGLTDGLVTKLCSLGDTVDYRVYAGANHNSALTAAKPDLVAWIADRFAGRPATSTC